MSVFPPCVAKQTKVQRGSSAAALCLFAAQAFAGPTGETRRQDAQKHPGYTRGLMTMMMMDGRGVLKSLLSTTRSQESTAATQADAAGV